MITVNHRQLLPASQRLFWSEMTYTGATIAMVNMIVHYHNQSCSHYLLIHFIIGKQIFGYHDRHTVVCLWLSLTALNPYWDIMAYICNKVSFVAIFVRWFLALSGKSWIFLRIGPRFKTEPQNALEFCSTAMRSETLVFCILYYIPVLYCLFHRYSKHRHCWRG